MQLVPIVAKHIPPRAPVDRCHVERRPQLRRTEHHPVIRERTLGRLGEARAGLLDLHAERAKACSHLRSSRLGLGRL